MTDDELAGTVARVWADVLRLPEIDPADGFFARGGTSLTALRVVFTLRERLAVELSLRDLMSSRTLAEFTATVRTALTAGPPARPAVALTGRRGTR